MNRETERQARNDQGAAPQIVDLRERVPEMDDKALATLFANAQRLASSGNARQKAGAADLLPVIEAELAKRAGEKAAAAATKAAASAAKLVKKSAKVQ